MAGELLRQPFGDRDTRNCCVNTEAKIGIMLSHKFAPQQAMCDFLCLLVLCGRKTMLDVYHSSKIMKDSRTGMGV
jgi:hypothetical protein